jgi:hypothetical protein
LRAYEGPVLRTTPGQGEGRRQEKIRSRIIGPGAPGGGAGAEPPPAHPPHCRMAA